ncbi:MAG: EboA domain-containing protein [Fibrobacteres bacterium]|nr:EboA domain-containing protein [Fibrobacterota bacterium]
MSAQTLLLDWLKTRIPTDGLAWLEEKAALMATGAPDKTIFASFSACVRHAGKAPLSLSAEDLQAARAAVPDWDPSDLWQTADVGEAITLQKALAVVPYPEGHMARAREAIRSNIKAVFEAIAIRNPYPSLHFDTVGWNQMVVKTFFVDVPLALVVGVDRRANPPLARMLDDLAHERWAANRPFPPDLWRCVGPCADAKALADLKKVLTTGSPVERRAAALALKSCPDPQAAAILASDAALEKAARSGSLTWENLNDYA